MYPREVFEDTVHPKLVKCDSHAFLLKSDINAVSKRADTDLEVFPYPQIKSEQIICVDNHAQQNPPSPSSVLE